MDICNLNKFIRVNNLQEVTNPITFDSGRYPTKDGVLSYEIFGISGSYDRKTIFGYIDLKKKFLHPLIYNELKKMDRKIAQVVDGSGYFSINDKGELVEDNEKGHNGLQWLYKNFEKLKYAKNGSFQRDNRITMLNSMSKDEIFVDKWLCIPAFYRDVNISQMQNGKLGKDELNNMYVKLINLAQSGSSEFELMGVITENNIQKTLNQIYEYLIGYLDHKKGMIKQGLLGKTVDYSTRSVISAGRIAGNTMDDQIVKFTYTGVPLSHLCNLFLPFFQYEIRSWAEEVFSTVKQVKGNSGQMYDIVDGMAMFTPDAITKMISLYIKSPENRLDPIMVTIRNPKTGKTGKSALTIYQDDLGRRFTLLDLIYITAHKVCADKHLYITRYPVDNFQSIFPSRIKILSTYKTTKKTINNQYFEDYPVVDEVPDISKPPVTYIDTVIPHNTMLQALGADYDGKIFLTIL